MRGRKPTPTKLKLVRGNPGKRELNRREPTPGLATTRPPGDLSAGAKRQWRKIAKQLHDAGVLTVLDRHALALYCEAFTRYAEANAKLASMGLLVKAPSGYPIQNPYLAIANKASDQMLRIMSEFGMTPSSRTRVTKIDPAPTENDPWHKFARSHRLETYRKPKYSTEPQ